MRTRSPCKNTPRHELGFKLDEDGTTVAATHDGQEPDNRNVPTYDACQS